MHNLLPAILSLMAETKERIFGFNCIIQPVTALISINPSKTCIFIAAERCLLIIQIFLPTLTFLWNVFHFGNFPASSGRRPIENGRYQVRGLVNMGLVEQKRGSKLNPLGKLYSSKKLLK